MKDQERTDMFVISGIGGKYPQCHNTEEFKAALMNHVDLLTENSDRYPAGIWGLPKRCGVIPDVEKFDASFFGIHPKQVGAMDPRHRKLLETVHECIIDAGYNPAELRGKKIGVYVGITTFANTPSYYKQSTDGYLNIGISLAIAANRVSYCFNLKGPSYALDTACSSAMYCLVNAMNDLEMGITDGAIVCGTHLVQHPHETFEFFNLNMLSPDGACKVFSTERDGYVRAETVSCVLVQKASDCRRMYARIHGVRSNADGFKTDGITFPSADAQYTLMKELYHAKGIDANTVSYVEAHGTGTPAGDVVECEAITKVFCETRKEPLLVGSVKSNMGHSEVSAGLCSITKVIFAMESGIIPANLHALPLDTSLPGIKDGKLKVLLENQKWDGGVVGVNCFGFGGANTHAILESVSEEKRSYPRHKNRLVQVSGRTEEAVQYFLDAVEKDQDDQEFLAMVDEIHKINVEGHPYRGYIVLGEKPIREIGKFTKDRPIWFVYTGMGSQWNKMGKDLMNNAIFRNTINRCAKALEPFGVDLINILVNDDPTIFDNITNAFCAIGCTEIALTDVLHSLGIVPDGICGHSLGEVGCAYADGQITPEQAALLAYSRGYASTNTKIIPGQMAAVGLSKEEISKMLPEGIFIACQNAKKSVTISGPKESTIAFVEHLSSQGIFAKAVKTADIAYHTKYVAEAGKLLYDFCKNVLKDPKPRSSKWITSSVPLSQQNEKWARMNCAEYHHNNFCNAVLFDQVYEYIPLNAIVVEVAPHGLLQAILKREMGAESTNISTTNRSSDDNEKFFLSSIGKIYIAGGQPNLRNLYNEVTFPVGRGTKMLSPLVKWDHGISWFSGEWQHQNCFGNTITVNISHPEYSHLDGHEIDGRILMPATAYPVLAWKTLAEFHLATIEEFPVVIKDLKIKRATVLTAGEGVQFLVNIMSLSGYFEICESGSIVCTGVIRIPEDINNEFKLESHPKTLTNSHVLMKSEDVYKECHLRRFMYKGLFQGITECDIHGINGKIKWKGKFDSFLDTMLHLKVISVSNRDFYLPTAIQQIVIDPIRHLKISEKQDELDLTFHPELNIIKSGGIEIVGLQCSKAPKRQHAQDPPYLEVYDFVPFETSIKNQYDLDTSFRIALQIILQNNIGQPKDLNICEIVTNDIKPNVIATVQEILDKQAVCEVQYSIRTQEKLESNLNLIVIDETVLRSINLDVVLKNLVEDGFILYKGNYSSLKNASLQIIFHSITEEGSVYLLRPFYQEPSKYSVINIKNTDFNWLEDLKQLSSKDDSKIVYLFNQNEETSGLLGLVNSLLCEPINLIFKAFLIDQADHPFSVTDSFYKNQLKKNLQFNVFKNNSWGTFVHLPLKIMEKRNVGNAAINILTVGDLSTIDWIERPLTGLRTSEESEEIFVYYSALNFRDVMVTTGKLALETPQDSPMCPTTAIGIEFAGVTTKGKRVMGMVPLESIALQINSHPDFIWEVPEKWTLRDACTIPCVYATCYYALLIRGNLQPQESILIHAGTGGVGLAAINIALSMDCQVYTTVSSKEKREFLKKMFPALQDQNIGNSRNASFENMVKINTKGRGVDLVLNSLADDLFQASIRCLANRGRFLEIGKVDLTNSSPIPTPMFLRNISFHGISVDELFTPQREVKQEIGSLLANGITKGVVKPLPSHLFDETQVEVAFRFLASGKHRGKVLIEIRKEDRVSPKTPIRTISAIPQLYFDPNKSYILVGGLGGFGLELTDWMIKKGATKIILNSRRDVHNGYQTYCLKKWSNYKTVSVRINTSNTSSLKGAEDLVNFAQQLGPVGGIFNMALVVKDATLPNQTIENYVEVFNSKLISGQNMDTISRKVCHNLDHFVVFSTIACGRGNAGQSNYAMANSALERLCEKRKREGYPALAIQWGPIGEVGILRKMGVEEKIFYNIAPQKISSCLNTLEKFMLQSYTIGSSVVLVDKDKSETTQNRKTPIEAVAHILGIEKLDLVDKSLTLSQLGLDSLMITEVKQTLYRNFELEFSPEKIRHLTLNYLITLADTDADNDKIKSKKQTVELKTNYKEDIYLLSDESVIQLNRSASSKKNFFLVHPMEGHVEVLKPLAKKLQATVYGLQCTTENIFDSIIETANYYVKKIKEIQPNGLYYLCGYSYGAMLVSEITIQLERSGDSVTVVCLDGSPYQVRDILETVHVKQGRSMEKSEQIVLERFWASFPQVSVEQLRIVQVNLKSWDQRLQVVADIVSKATGVDKEKIRISANAYYKRALAAIDYEPSTTIKGKVMLIRRINNPYAAEDYDLQKVCAQPIEIVKVPGDHKSMLLGHNTSNVANIIYNFFNSNVL